MFCSVVSRTYSIGPEGAMLIVGGDPDSSNAAGFGPFAVEPDLATPHGEDRPFEALRRIVF